MDECIAQKLEKISSQKRIPLSVDVELTYCCNLNCKHCYLQGRKVSGELATAELFRLFDELREMGTLYLTFTGGEPLLRPDFYNLADYAKESAFALVIFTNGTLITESEAFRIAECSPLAVHISLLGAEPETHDSITGVRGSFRKVIRAVKFLKRAGVRVVLKTALMKQNYTEYEGIVSICEQLEAEWQFDMVVSPTHWGGVRPLQYRLNQEQWKALLKDKRFFSPEKFSPTRPEALLCSAGLNLVAVTPLGEVYPCLAWPCSLGNVREKSFKDIWEDSPYLTHLRKTEISNVKECPSCPLLSYCPRCPGMAFLEEGDFRSPSRTNCQFAEAIGDSLQQARQYK